MRRLLAALGALVLTAASASAQTPLAGHYPPGQSGLRGGASPPVGWAYTNFSRAFTNLEAKDAGGETVREDGQPMNIDGYRRRRILVGRESFGFAFKIETTGLLKNLKIYDLSAELAPQREDSYSRLVSQ